MEMRQLKIVMLLLVTILLSSVTVRAQSFSASITGDASRVTDSITVTPATGVPLDHYMMLNYVTNSTGTTVAPAQCLYLAGMTPANPFVFTYDVRSWASDTYTFNETLFLPSTLATGRVESDCDGLNGLSYQPTSDTFTLPVPAPNCPAAPTLVNPQSIANGAVFGGHTVDGTGAIDTTAAFSSAASSGDLDIKAGVYLINGTVPIPSNRNVLCEAGAILKTTNTANNSNDSPMLSWSGSTGGELYDCSFQGPNYNVSGRPGFNVNGQFYFFVALSTNSSHTGGGTIVANNDFNGVYANSAVWIYGSDANGPDNNNTIVCNSFEHSGYYGVAVVSGNNNTVRNNTFLDSACCAEADDTGQQQTGNLFTSNNLTFVNGVGYTGSNNAAALTGGIPQIGSSCFNYSGNTVSSNNVSGPYVNSHIVESPGGSCSSSFVSTYTSNTCTGGCTVD